MLLKLLSTKIMSNSNGVIGSLIGAEHFTICLQINLTYIKMRSTLPTNIVQYSKPTHTLTSCYWSENIITSSAFILVIEFVFKSECTERRKTRVVMCFIRSHTIVTHENRSPRKYVRVLVQTSNVLYTLVFV